jgi:hypothetical protein
MWWQVISVIKSNPGRPLTVKFSGGAAPSAAGEVAVTFTDAGESTRPAVESPWLRFTSECHRF